MDVPVGGHLKSIALEFSLLLCSDAPFCFSLPFLSLYLPILEARNVAAAWCRDAVFVLLAHLKINMSRTDTMVLFGSQRYCDGIILFLWKLNI